VTVVLLVTIQRTVHHVHVVSLATIVSIAMIVTTRRVVTSVPIVSMFSIVSTVLIAGIVRTVSVVTIVWIVMDVGVLVVKRAGLIMNRLRGFYAKLQFSCLRQMFWLCYL
jgi:hypothetical protein